MSEDLEEPKFEILHEYKGFEIRKYVDTIQARVSSPDSEEVNSSIHFRQIANYIFGNNDKSQNISMTARPDWYPYSLRRIRENPDIWKDTMKAFFFRSKHKW